MKRLTNMLGLLVLAAGLAWTGGFLWFVQRASRPAEPLPHADGIVVLTGGSNRIEQGLRLLQQGQAPRLLVSGVAPGTGIDVLAHAAGIDPAPLASRITLGQSAISTHGNAEETVDWVNRYNLNSLIVVTAFYHMPRAMAELRRALPDTTLYPRPVLPDSVLDGSSPAPLGLLAKEYTKWLVVQAGMPRYAADRRPGEGLK